jgi:hypothetical protein
MFENNIEIFINILILSSFILIFLFIFYFNYLIDQERYITINNIDYTLNDLNPILDLLPDDNKNYINNTIKNLKIDNISDHDIIINNNLIYTKSMIFISIYCIICILSSLYLINKYKLDLFKIISQNLILLTSVIIVEYLILKYVMRHYIYADYNYLIFNIINKIKSYKI